MKTPTPKTTWHQIDGVHRWELRNDASQVLATAWWQHDHWHWSVPAEGMPRRGAHKLFRAALHEAEAAAGVRVAA